MRILWICSAQIVGGAERVSLQVLERWRARGHTLDALLEHASPVQRLTEAAGLAAADDPHDLGRLLVEMLTDPEHATAARHGCPGARP